MCIFCKIIQGNVPSTLRWSNDEWIAINDIHPKADTHVLLISKKHISSLEAATEEDEGLLTSVLPALRTLARVVSVSQQGYRIVNNCGRSAGQLVDHLHFHLMSGKIKGGDSYC